MTRLTALIVSDSFAPGFRGGGTRHAIAAVRALNDEIDFLVLTRDREPGAASPFDVEADRWINIDDPAARVRYVSPRSLGLIKLARALDEITPDIVMTNSVFSRLSMRVLLLKRLNRLRAPVIVAPEGEFFPGALALKAGRKALFRAMARATGLFRHVTWRATSDEEARQIQAWAGSSARVVVAPVVTPRLTDSPPPDPPAKRPGELQLVYLSRITPKKNLQFLLDVLADPIGRVHLDIVGPIDDEKYWRACRHAIDRLPDGTTVTYRGEARPDEIDGWIGGAHALVLPTHGENFGLVIHEALAAARPVLIGVDTPWSDLERLQAGCNLRPDDSAAWRSALGRFVAMDGLTWSDWSKGARRVARQFEDDDDAKARLASLLRDAAS